VASGSRRAQPRLYVIALDFPGFSGSAKVPAHALPSAVALADAVEGEVEVDQHGGQPSPRGRGGRAAFVSHITG
jgi:hypothetical protein